MPCHLACLCRDKFGLDGLRIFRLLADEQQQLEQKQVGSAPQHLHCPACLPTIGCSVWLSTCRLCHVRSPTLAAPNVCAGGRIIAAAD